MPAYLTNHTGGRFTGCAGLTEARVFFSGGNRMASALGAEATFDRAYEDLDGFHAIENEEQNYLSLIVRRTNDFKPLSSVTFDSIKFDRAFREDFLKFAINARILSNRFKK